MGTEEHAKHIKLSTKEHEALAKQTEEITALGERLRAFVTAEVAAFHDNYPQTLAWSFSLDEVSSGFRIATILNFSGQTKEEKGTDHAD